MKAIIIYYSKSGTTEKLAMKIKKGFHCEAVKVEPDKKYGGYLAAVARVGVEKMKKSVPAYHAPEVDFSEYDTVFVGYPIWYSKAPSFLLDYLGKQDLNGKTVIPFSTSGGSNIKVTLPSLEEAVKGAEIKYPYNYGKSSKDRDDIKAWAKKVSALSKD